MGRLCLIFSLAFSRTPVVSSLHGRECEKRIQQFSSSLITTTTTTTRPSFVLITLIILLFYQYKYNSSYLTCLQTISICPFLSLSHETNNNGAKIVFTTQPSVFPSIRSRLFSPRGSNSSRYGTFVI